MPSCYLSVDFDSRILIPLALNFYEASCFIPATLPRRMDAPGRPFAHGVGAKSRVAQVALHWPKAALQASTAGAVATPAVTVPNTKPAAE